MKNILTFIIPVRHQDNASDWRSLKNRLGQTIRSISSQDAEGWKAVIVANHGADIPDLPKNFDVKRVDFPPNPFYARGNTDIEMFRDAVRIDKGRRILAGMLHAGEMGHIMIVDDDDFVSRRLTSFVAAHRNENGWYFNGGLVWGEGGILMYRRDKFWLFCGTSHIIRSDLYQIPPKAEAADETYIRRMLGSHIFIKEYLGQTGTPLAPLPFIGTIYRTGHAGSHSKSAGVLKQYLLQRSLLKKPWLVPARFARLRIKTSQIETEFFGKALP
jgi:hypothetical protein